MTFTTEITKGGLKSLATKLGATFKPSKDFATNHEACRAKFIALSDDDKVELLQECFGTVDYDANITPLEYFNDLVEVTGTVEENEGNGEEIVTKAGKITFEVTNASGVTTTITRTPSSTSNEPKNAPKTITITAAYKTAIPSGNQNWVKSDLSPVDVLNGQKNVVVMFEGMDEDGQPVTIPTNLRFVNGVKGKRLFGEMHQEGDGMFMPVVLVDKNGVFKKDVDFKCVVVGKTISKELGHTYTQTSPNAVAAATAGGFTSSIVDVTVAGVKTKGVILKYESETAFSFSTFGTALGSTLGAIFQKRLDNAIEREDLLKRSTEDVYKKELLDAEHNEKNLDKLVKGDEAKAKRQQAFFNTLVKGGMDAELAAKVAFK